MCKLRDRLRSTFSSRLMIATSTQVLIAIQARVFTAFSLVLKNALIRRFCLIPLKNSSTCQRDLYHPATVRAGIVTLFVRKTNRRSVAASWYDTRRRGSGGNCDDFTPASAMV